MKNNLQYLKLAFLISFVLGLFGTYLTARSYYHKQSVMSAKKQLEFMKNLPSLASDGSRYKIPAFTEDPALKAEKSLKLELVSAYFDDKISLRKAVVNASGPLFYGSKLEAILDARERYEKK